MLLIYPFLPFFLVFFAWTIVFLKSLNNKSNETGNFNVYYFHLKIFWDFRGCVIFSNVPRVRFKIKTNIIFIFMWVKIQTQKSQKIVCNFSHFKIHATPEVQIDYGKHVKQSCYNLLIWHTYFFCFDFGCLSMFCFDFCCATMFFFCCLLVHLKKITQPLKS